MADKNISSTLKNARLRMGFSQKDVYTMLGIKQSRFSAWENCVSEPDIRTFLRLCRIYKIKNIYNTFCSHGDRSGNEAAGTGAKSPALDNAIDMLCAVYDDSDLFSNVMNCLEYEHSKLSKRRRAVEYPLRPIPVYAQPAAAGLGNYITDDDSEYIEMAAPPDTDAGIRISGDSMEPDISDGDIVFIKFTPEIEYGQIGIFVLGGSAYCKKLDRIDGHPCLTSINPKYSPIFIGENNDLRTVGRVLIRRA